ncbi:hypothetical protein DRH14_04290 [Candidatus Shapirobacteria bacterium]|nr:MAG: hypothetical protein DRH14_04290 [Candidatus Shapirobacteria bacterium]
MGWLQENADELAALIFVITGILVAIVGIYAKFVKGIEIDLKEILMAFNGTSSPGATYLFGKSQPKGESK